MREFRFMCAFMWMETHASPAYDDMEIPSTYSPSLLPNSFKNEF